MRLPEAAIALLTIATPLAAQPASQSPPPPAPQQAGDAVPEAAIRHALLADTYRYFAEKDGARYDAAYQRLAPSMRSYLTFDLYRSTAATFNDEAGAVEQRRVTKLTWERDPADAPEKGLYVAADFTARFPNIDLMCGYVMWKQQSDGTFRIVREEQSFVDKAMAARMVPERRETLPRQLGCVEG